MNNDNSKNEISQMKEVHKIIDLSQLTSIIIHFLFRFDFLKVCTPENSRIINDDIVELITGNKIGESNYNFEKSTL